MSKPAPLPQRQQHPPCDTSVSSILLGAESSPAQARRSACQIFILSEHFHRPGTYRRNTDISQLCPSPVCFQFSTTVTFVLRLDLMVLCSPDMSQACCGTENNLERMPLPLPPRCWNCRHSPPHLVLCILCFKNYYIYLFSVRACMWSCVCTCHSV